MRLALSAGGFSTAWIAIAFLAAGFALDPQDGGEDPIVVSLREELARAREVWKAREADLIAEVALLRAELQQVEEARIAREREWLVPPGSLWVVTQRLAKEHKQLLGKNSHPAS